MLIVPCAGHDIIHERLALDHLIFCARSADRLDSRDGCVAFFDQAVDLVALELFFLRFSQFFLARDQRFHFSCQLVEVRIALQHFNFFDLFDSVCNLFDLRYFDFF